MSRPRFRVKLAAEARGWDISEPEPGLLRVTRRGGTAEHLFMVALSDGGALQWATGPGVHYGPGDLDALLQGIRSLGFPAPVSPISQAAWMSLATAEAMASARGRILARAAGNG